MATSSACSRGTSRSTGFPGETAVERKLWALAEECTPQSRVDEYTQAIMDLGATVCTRSNPACLLCPVNDGCVARRESRQHLYPAPRPRKVRPQREAWVLLAQRGSKVLLERRPPTGIWGGLWGLPEFPTREHAPQWCGEHLSGASATQAGEPLRHAFSHFDYELKPLVVHCAGKAPALRDDDRYRWYDVEAPAEVGVPKPIATLLQGDDRAGQDAAGSPLPGKASPSEARWCAQRTEPAFAGRARSSQWAEAGIDRQNFQTTPADQMSASASSIWNHCHSATTPKLSVKS